MSSTPAGLRALAFPILTLLAASIGGCAATTAEFDDAKSLRVSYWDFRTGIEATIVNEDDPGFEDLYSTAQKANTIKLAPREVIVDLVSFAESEGFFDHAGSLSGPTDVDHPEPFRLIVFSADGSDHSLLLYKGLADENLEAVKDFDAVQREFLDTYNNIIGFQYTPSMKPSDFQREQEQRRQEFEELLKKQGAGGTR